MLLELDCVRTKKANSSFVNKIPLVGPTSFVDTFKIATHVPANTKHLYNVYRTPAQQFRRWSNIVYMLYKCFVFTGMCLCYG